jgi:hypothetical protein
LRKKIIAYVKDEGSNLNTIIFAKKKIISCDTLYLEESYQSTFFGHTFSKAWKYVTIDEKLCKKLT